MVLLIALALWLLPVWSHAATYYVATTGHDANVGSEASPWKTVKKAVDTMVAGDTTYLRGGTYTETEEVRFTRSGTSSAPITLKAYPNETPVVGFTDRTNGNHRVSIWHASGSNVAIGWIVIEGLTFTNCAVGVRFYSAHDVIIRGNTFYDNNYHGMLGNGTRILIDRNVIGHNGQFARCLAGEISCNKEHGIYMNGSDITITNNVIYDNLAYGIQQNGSSSAVFNSAVHPSAEFANSLRWIIANNTIAYNRYRSAIAVWGSLCDDTRIENNIFYENSVSSSSANGIDWVSATSSLGVRVRNNHVYASGGGGTAFQSSGAPSDLVSTGNVVNVSAPAFVAGGSGTLPGSPDFRLTASSPVNIALANEFANNSTNVVGAYKTVGTPTASMMANKITIILPMSTAVPVQNLSTSGVSISCTSNVCPGSPVVSVVSRVTNTDSHVEVTLSGITGNACASHADPVTISYSLGSGTWTGNDNIGAYPGLNQKLFSFTGLAVVNNCTGSGPTGYPGGYHIHYKFDDGTGTNANDESANNLDGTLTNSPTWGTGKTGSGVVTTGGTQHVAIPYGSGINPSTQSLTIAFGVNVPSGQESLSRNYFGAPLGSSQRLYVSTASSTWRIGIQGSNDATAGNIAVTSGWHNVCLVLNSSTDVATLYIDGVASTAAGAVKSYTSYTLAGDFDLGRIADVTTNAAAGTYDDFFVYTSVEDCAAIYAAFNEAATAPAGTLSQTAIQFQGVILDTAGTPIVVGPSVQTIEVPQRGGAVLLFQVNCSAGTNCDQTAFKLTAAKNGSSTWQQVPNIETPDGTWMWGVTTETNLNNGTRSTRLTGTCTVEPGVTLFTADQVPSLAIPQTGCTVIAYVVHVDGVAGQDYFDYKLQTESGLDLPGGYTQTARIRVVSPMASGIGF